MLKGFIKKAKRKLKQFLGSQPPLAIAVVVVPSVTRGNYRTLH